MDLRAILPVKAELHWTTKYRQMWTSHNDGTKGIYFAAFAWFSIHYNGKILRIKRKWNNESLLPSTINVLVMLSIVIKFVTFSSTYQCSPWTGELVLVVFAIRTRSRKSERSECYDPFELCRKRLQALAHRITPFRSEYSSLFTVSIVFSQVCWIPSA